MPSNEPQSDGRPDPGLLLAALKREEARQGRGRLKIFLGMAPGVGKTYAMLQEAHALVAAGREVVVGVVESHGRAETAALVEGLEVVPQRAHQRAERTLYELDLDAILARRPKKVLIDELAHTNVTGSRHPKRFQDVEELLANGIDVHTTLNIQHIESLNDIIARVTGVRVQETVPDALLDAADTVVVVDLPPDELLDRLQRGKVYRPEQAKRALHNFFRRGNLLALRELVLRRTADRVDAEVREFAEARATTPQSVSAQRLLVAVGPSPLSGRLVRVASRMAAAHHAEFIAVHVDLPSVAAPDDATRVRILDHLRLAEALGARTATLTGHTVPEALLEYARSQRVTTIVVGYPTEVGLLKRLRGSLVDALLAQSGDIDVHVVSSAADLPPPHARPLHWRALHAGSGWIHALLAVAAATLAAQAVDRVLTEADQILLFVGAIVLAAWRLPLGPSLLAAALSVISFNFFFVDPRYTFYASDLRFLFTFTIMGTVVFLITTMAARVKRQRSSATAREGRTRALYAFMGAIAGADSPARMGQEAVKTIAEVFGADVTLFLRQTDGSLTASATAGTALLEPSALVAAQWSMTNRKPAGAGTDTLAGVDGQFLPLISQDDVIGVLGLRTAQPDRLAMPESRELLRAMQEQLALGLQRLFVSDASRTALVSLEIERTRAALLSSVSHDLRTPLGTILGTTSTLLDPTIRLDDPTRRSLLETAHAEAERLQRLVQNLLEATRVTEGTLRLRKEWHVPEELVGATLARFSALGHDHAVEVHAADTLCLMDATLVELALGNLVDNALKYAPGTKLTLLAQVRDGACWFEVRDEGPGLGESDPSRLFEKFYRGEHNDARGSGLGLAICKAVADAHGGTSWASNREDGPGAVFGFTIPQPGAPPEVYPSRPVEHEAYDAQ